MNLGFRTIGLESWALVGQTDLDSKSGFTEEVIYPFSFATCKMRIVLSIKGCVVGKGASSLSKIKYPGDYDYCGFFLNEWGLRVRESRKECLHLQ